jgi:Spy/CpxP family protein refolding chaperone
MKRVHVLTCTLVLLLNCSLVSWSQDAAKPATKAAEPAKKVTNRLPSNYGKLGLTDAQRDKVYAIQEKYDSQLDALEDQVKALKAKRTSESEAVLTPEQKKILKDLTDDAKEKDKDKDAKSKSKKSDKTDKDAASDKEKK